MLRIAFYSHDTFGLGHLSRCLKLARAISPALLRVEGLLITGSAWTRLFARPENFRFVHLPPVVKDGRSYRPRGGEVPFADLLAERRRRIASTLADFRPDLLVVDNVPCGLRGEMLPALRAARRSGHTRTVLALRDILDRPDAIAAEWGAAGAAEALAGLYDEIWLFGGAADVERLAGRGLLPTSRVVACGRLEAVAAPAASPTHQPGSGAASRGESPAILVTGGGGGDAEPLVRAYLETLRRVRPRVRSRVVLGPDFPPGRIEPLLRRNGFSADIRRTVSDLPAAIAASDLVVAMAGYNTVCEIDACGRRTVLVPRVWPRQEQLIRARELERAGRASVLPADELTPAALWSHIESALAGPAPPPLLHRGGREAARRAAALLGREPVGA